MPKPHRNWTTTVLLLAFAVAGVGCVSQSPDQVSDSELAVYQADNVKGCKVEGLRKGAKPENVDAFCNCMIAVLKTDMSHADWQLAAMYWRQGKSEKERKVVFAHVERVKTCKTLEN